MVIKDKELDPQLLDQLLHGVDLSNPNQVLGTDGIIKQLTKAILERCLSGELSNHLGYDKNSSEGINSGNSRNGSSSKRIQTEEGEIDLTIPRDRNGTFEPVIVSKHQRRFTGLDDKIIALYARGLSTRDTQALLKEIYNVDVSADLISQVTASVMEEVVAWQHRPLAEKYAFVFLDALFVNIRDNGHIVKKAIYVALGINLQGTKELLGLWIQKTEGAKFWLSILTELKHRGVTDILFVCVDGLKGFPEAIESVFPYAIIQECIVHVLRNSFKYLAHKDRKEVVADLKTIYQAITEKEASVALDAFAEKWKDRYDYITKLWRDHWQYIIPYFSYSIEIRRVMYTTNQIESLHRQLRKVIKTKGVFPTDESATKLLYLVIRNVSKKWTGKIPNWGKIINDLTIVFEERVSLRM